MMASSLLKQGGSDVTATPTQLSETVAINLGSHCLFCLQPQQVDKLVEVAGKDPPLSRDPRPIIHYLTGTDPSYDRSEEECEEMGMPARTTFPPMMCPSCYDILAELYRLHGQLLEVQRMIQKQTEVAREMIINSQKAPPSTVNSRQQFYSKIQASGMSLEWVTTTAKFVDNFHTKIVFEAAGNNTVKFPDRLPPDSPSKSDGRINCSIKHSTAPSSPVYSSGRTSKSSVAGGSNNFQPVTVNSSDFGVVKLPQEVQGLDPMLNVKYETADDEAEVHGEDLFEELDNFMASDIDQDTTAMSANEEEPDDVNFSPSSSSTDQSSLSWSPPSPEPTTSTRGSKRKYNETVETIAKSFRKSSLSSRGKSTSLERKTQSKPKQTRNRRSAHQTIRPLVVEGSSTFQHCDICGELCPSSEINTHLETQHQLKDFIIQCPNRACPYVFSCKRKLDVHLAMPSYRRSECRREANLGPNPSLIKKCELCRFRSRTRKDFENHLKTHEASISDKSMTCPIPECSMEFGMRQSVDEHLFHHNEYIDQYQIRDPNSVPKRFCDVCPKKIFPSKMQSHLETHNLKEYITKCPNPTCNYVFSCRRNMERHVSLKEFQDCKKIANLPSSYPSKICEICKLKVSKNKFINHLHHHELQFKDKNIPCPIPSCPDRYALRQSIEEHLLSHGRGRRLSKLAKGQECSICNLRMEMEDVEEHLKEVHKIEDVIRCRRCPFLFHDWEALLDHLEIHRLRSGRQGGGGGGFFCDICNDVSGVKFMTYNSLRMHFFNVHKIGKEYFCEVCDRKFFYQAMLSLHQKTMHSIKSQDDEDPAPAPVMVTKMKRTKLTYECDQCPDTHFSTIPLLQTHKIQKHGAPPVTCKICNKEFLSVDVLRRHERVHVGVKTAYKCRVDNCGKEYDNMTSWKNHERSHNDDPNLKLFVCDTCGKRFNNGACLYQHTARVHEGRKETRRICDICGESFATATSLKRHTLIHSGERPFQCTICGQAFRHRSVLKTHLESHERKGDSFKPNGPMKNVRKRVAPAASSTQDDQAE